jgi:hypothetical protein
MESDLQVYPTNVFLIEIQGYLSHWALEDYIQEASKGPGERFFVTTKGCGRSISSKRCIVLACGISYLPKNHGNIIKNEEYGKTLCT